MPSWLEPDSWVSFDAPAYLILIAVLPIFWFVGRRSLRALGSWRQHMAMLLRMAIATLLIVALAEPNWMTMIHRLTVLFLVDGSASVEQGELTHALNYVSAAAKQRQPQHGDRAGVVVFGRDAAVEVPPTEHPWQLSRIESDIEPEHTNLDSALQLAKASFPADTLKRVVIVSDGKENVGNAQPQARELLDSSIGIDVVPIHYQRQGDVVVEKVVAPTEIRSRAPFDLRVVVDNRDPKQTIGGTIRVTREAGGVRQVVAEQPVQLEPGKRVLSIRQELTDAGFSTYEATFVPDDSAADLHRENNASTAFCHVGGPGRVLLVEDASLPGRFTSLVELLRKNDIEVTVRDTRRPFDNLADLQQFDTVILADVSRIAGDGPTGITQIADEQIHQLVQNTEHFGCGLVVLGGPNSFGAGGWNNSELEKALPVDFQIESHKVEASGALVLVIDSSGSMTGDKILWSKQAAMAAAQMLGKRDYIGVVSFDYEFHWIVPVQRNDTTDRTRSRIAQLGASGGTNLMPALHEAYRAIQGTDASLKHVIVLTDGQTPKDNFASLVTDMRRRGITTTGVAVGPDADRALLAELGQRGGGKFYHVQSPKAIPSIFMREARRVAMPLVFEDPGGIAVRSETSSEVLNGIVDLPPITGFILTTVKKDPLVEVLLSTPRQPQPNSTILATWQYGLGRAAVLTTDVGQRWANSWPEWESYEKLMLQLMRWSMRSHETNETLMMTADSHEGEIQVVINALNPDDARTNLLNLRGTSVAPDGQADDFDVTQAAPGRYVGIIEADKPGNYYLSVDTGKGAAPLRTAVHISRTTEFDNLESNDALMFTLAEGVPKNGSRGKVITSSKGLANKEALLTTDVFRRDLPAAKARDSMWPIVLLAASVAFLGDVFCRRVVISWEWLLRLLAWLPSFGRPALAESPLPRMERLKQSKASAVARFEALRSEPSFDPTTAPAEPATPAAPVTVEDTAHSPYFTSRLLEAKKRARENQSRQE